MNRTLLICCSAIFGVIALDGLPAVAEAPVVTALTPRGCQPGGECQVTVALAKPPQELSTLLFSQAGISATRIKSGQFQIQIAGDVPPGDYDVWAVGSNGISRPGRFVVNPHPVYSENNKNDDTDHAEAVSLPGIVEAKFEKRADIDWFRFTGTTGQRVTIVCRSLSLDGSAEPAVSLFGPNGSELDHAAGHRYEPLLHIALPADGEYKLRLTNRAYQQADSSIYRLSLHVGSFVTAAFPSMLPKGQTSRVLLFGFDLPNGQPVAVGNHPHLQQLAVDVVAPQVGDAGNGGWVSSSAGFEESFAYQHPATAGNIRFLLSDGSIVTEVEQSNDEFSTGQVVEIPSLVCGRCEQTHDLDWYRFTAKKGQSLTIAVRGDRREFPMDLDAAIVDGAGKIHTTLKDVTTPKGFPAEFPLDSLDAAGTWKVPADGEYAVVVRDLYGGSLAGVARHYRLSIRENESEFQVFAMANDPQAGGLMIPRGGGGVIKVIAVRRGYNGPIHVMPTNLPAGWHTEGCWIPAGENSALCAVTCDADAKTPAVAALIDISAEAKTSATTTVHAVRGATIVDAGANKATRLADGIVVASGELAAFSAELQPISEPVAAGSKLVLPVKLTVDRQRVPGDVTYQSAGLPAAIKPVTGKLQEQTDSFITLPIPKTMQPGWYSVVLEISAKVAQPTAKASEAKQPTGKQPTSKTTPPKPVDFKHWSNAISFQVVAPPAEAETPAKPAKK